MVLIIIVILVITPILIVLITTIAITRLQCDGNEKNGSWLVNLLLSFLSSSRFPFSGHHDFPFLRPI